MLPSEYIDHMLGLLPDPRTLYEVYLLDALPPNARVAALQHSSLHAMARAADAVVLESRAVSESVNSTGASINSMSLLDTALSNVTSVPPPLLPTPPPSASVASLQRDRRSAQPRKPSSLCGNHAKYGKEAYRCLLPSSCKMSHIICPRPTSTAPGNAKAGSRQ